MLIRTIVQCLLIAWFITCSLFVLIPSCQALAKAPDKIAAEPPPNPPSPPAAADEKSTALYAQQVASYQNAVTAYTAYSQMAEKLMPVPAYEAVVTKTLLPLLEK